MTNEIILIQAVVNLLSNAVFEIIDKKMEERWIKISAQLKDDQLHLQIVDSGPGIKQEIIDDIFEFGFSTKSQTDSEGSGVGLSFVRNSIENELGGKIQVLKEQPNTTFLIQLPQNI